MEKKNKNNTVNDIKVILKADFFVVLPSEFNFPSFFGSKKTTLPPERRKFSYQVSEL